MTDRLVTVAEYNFLPEAETYRMHLESAGIQAFLADAETVAMDWALGVALGYIKLQVPQSQAESATRILEEIQARRKEEKQNEAIAGGGMKCLACGAKMAPRQSECSECGWSYGDTEDEVTEHEFADDEPEAAPPMDPDRPADESIGWTEAFRSLKKPLLLATFGPLIGLVAIFVIWFLDGIIRLFIR